MGAVKHSSNGGKRCADLIKLAHEMNEEIFFTLWVIALAERARPRCALPPMPNMLANAISRMKTGLVRG